MSASLGSSAGPPGQAGQTGKWEGGCVECGCGEVVELEGLGAHLRTDHLGSLDLLWRCGNCEFESGTESELLLHCFRRRHPPDAAQTVVARAARLLHLAQQVYDANAQPRSDLRPTLRHRVKSPSSEQGELRVADPDERDDLDEPSGAGEASEGGDSSPRCEDAASPPVSGAQLLFRHLSDANASPSMVAPPRLLIPPPISLDLLKSSGFFFPSADGLSPNAFLAQAQALLSPAGPGSGQTTPSSVGLPLLKEEPRDGPAISQMDMASMAELAMGGGGLGSPQSPLELLMAGGRRGSAPPGAGQAMDKLSLMRLASQIRKRRKFEHIRRHQPWMNANDTRSRSSCAKCGGRFLIHDRKGRLNTSVLSNHAALHFPVPPYRCGNCSYQSARKANVENHIMRIHAHSAGAVLQAQSNYSEAELRRQLEDTMRVCFPQFVSAQPLSPKLLAQAEVETDAEPSPPAPPTPTKV